MLKANVMIYLLGGGKGKIIRSSVTSSNYDDVKVVWLNSSEGWIR